MSEPKGRGAAWTVFFPPDPPQGRRRSDEGRRYLKAPRRRAGRHGLNRAAGAAAGSTLALALLVAGCVFAAMAGPALSLHARSQALQQTMAKLAPTVRAVQVTAVWSNFADSLTNFSVAGQNLTASQQARATQEIKASLAGLPLPLGPGDWDDLSANQAEVTSGAAPSATLNGTQPRLEVLYRDPLTSNADLVAGSYSAPAEPTGTVAVAVTPQTAARFGVHPGSRVAVSTSTGTVTLVVTAVVRPREAGSTFWTLDPLPSQPSLVTPAGNKPYWAGGVFADPGQLAAMQTAFAGPGLEMNWEFPLAVSGLNADQAQGLAGALNRATTVTPRLTGSLEPAADNLNVTSALIPDLALFLSTQAGIETVLLLLSVSLIVIAAAVILLAARMMVTRRAGELAMLRARGGSLRQVTGLMARGAAIAALPAAAVGAAVAVTVIPGDAAASALGWLLAGITLAVALAGPALIAAWQHRKPAPASNPARILSAETGPRRMAWRRPVAEVTAGAACVAGLVVLRNQGVPAGGQVNPLLMIAPVLVAVPVVLIMLRLYPLAVRGLLRISARGTGATGFVALSAAARTSLTGVLPAFALVLALSLASFAGMISNGIARGETAAAWHSTGADVLIQPSPGVGPVTPGELKAIAAVRGVTHATAVWNTTWVTPFGQPVTVVAVDPASYAAVTATTPYPSLALGKLSGAARDLSAGAAVPVLASPDAAAVLGHGPVQLTSLTPAGPFPVRVAGLLSSTPAQPGGGTFVVMPQLTLPGPAGAPAPNMVLVSGSAIDGSQLSALVNRTMPGSTITFRSAVLASLTNSPLPHGASLMVTFTLTEAAVLGLLIVILGLALGSAERELTLARLTVMGHERDTSLVMAEAMPAVIAAVVAGAACSVVLPHLIGSSIDLSAFTGASAPVLFQPDVIALGLPAAAVVVLAVAALAAEARTLRHRGIAGILRAKY
jgi:putative ABC transport system permease protein